MVDGIDTTLRLVAVVYGAGQYSGGAYNTGALAELMANTGVAVLGVATLACLIIFVALVARIVQRKPRMQLAKKR